LVLGGVNINKKVLFLSIVLFLFTLFIFMYNLTTINTQTIFGVLISSLVVTVLGLFIYYLVYFVVKNIKSKTA